MPPTALSQPKNIIWRNGSHLLQTMSNTLYSGRLQTMIVWFPKCMCSTLRDFFIRLQLVLNPNIQNEFVNLNVHRIHRRQRFMYKDVETTPLRHVIMIVRDPVDRLVSTFFDKHVMRHQWHYLTLHNFRKFRIWCDVHSFQHTFLTYLCFIHEYGFIDIHDAPFVSQMPTPLRETGSIEDGVMFHIWSMDDPEWKSRFASLYETIFRQQQLPESIVSGGMKVVHECIRTVHRNHLPRTDKGIVPVPERGKMGTRRLSEWLGWIRRSGGCPPNRVFLNDLSRDEQDRVRALYRDDFCLLKSLFAPHTSTMRRVYKNIRSCPPQK